MLRFSQGADRKLSKTELLARSLEECSQVPLESEMAAFVVRSRVYLRNTTSFDWSKFTNDSGDIQGFLVECENQAIAMQIQSKLPQLLQSKSIISASKVSDHLLLSIPSFEMRALLEIQDILKPITWEARGTTLSVSPLMSGEAAKGLAAELTLAKLFPAQHANGVVESSQEPGSYRVILDKNKLSQFMGEDTLKRKLVLR